MKAPAVCALHGLESHETCDRCGAFACDQCFEGDDAYCSRCREFLAPAARQARKLAKWALVSVLGAPLLFFVPVFAPLVPLVPPGVLIAAILALRGWQVTRANRVLVPAILALGFAVVELVLMGIAVRAFFGLSGVLAP